MNGFPLQYRPLLSRTGRTDQNVRLLCSHVGQLCLARSYLAFTWLCTKWVVALDHGASVLFTSLKIYFCMSFALMDSWLVSSIWCSFGIFSYNDGTSVDGAPTGETFKAWGICLGASTIIDIVAMVTVVVMEG